MDMCPPCPLRVAEDQARPSSREMMIIIVEPPGKARGAAAVDAMLISRPFRNRSGTPEIMYRTVKEETRVLLEVA